MGKCQIQKIGFEEKIDYFKCFTKTRTLCCCRINYFVCDDGYCDIDASDGSSCGSGSGPGDNCNFGEINRFFQTIMTRDVIE